MPRREKSPEEKLAEALDDLSVDIRALKNEVSSLREATSNLSYNVHKLLSSDSNIAYLYQSIDELTEALKKLKK